MGYYRPVSYLIFCAALSAHEIPKDITVQTFLRPTAKQLQMLVRLPLKAMRDTSFPETRDGYLDTDKLASQLHIPAKIWIADFVEIFEGPERLPPPRIVATQISLPSDRSFTNFDTALAHIQGPKPPNSENLIATQVLFEVLLEYPIDNESSAFSIRPNFQGFAANVQTILRYQTPAGAIRAYEFHGDLGIIPLDPRWNQAFLRFVKLGFLHILEGTDHLLFLACLVIPFRNFRSLVWIATAFTIAHSLTLIATTYDLFAAPRWIEAAIAATILYTAIENIIGNVSPKRRWLTALAFGLIHGFAFSTGLRETLQFAGSHLLTSLLSFNLGVELGQILVLIVLIPILSLLFKYVVSERMGTIILSAFIAHTAWHWLQDRL